MSDAHDSAVARALDFLGLPPRNWVAATADPLGGSALDVLVVGAGMCGVAAAAALMFKGVGNIAVLDEAPAGQEGPWRSTARMVSLRSPKHLPGVALGIPSLTFRAWFTARQGEAAWAALYKISNGDWQDYLSWLQLVLALPVRHGVSVRAIEPAGALFRVGTSDGPVFARHVVLATGRMGAGGMLVPEFVDPALWPDRAGHTGEVIDFSVLAGRRVAVLGANASAFDAAAVALEAGAAADFLVVATGFAVDLARRPELAEVMTHVALWRDVYPPPDGLERAELGLYPFLGAGFELMEKSPGACPALARLHVFNHAAHASMGPIASDIPGVSAAAGLLSTAIVRALFRDGQDALQARLAGFAEPELESTPFFAPGALPGDRL